MRFAFFLTLVLLASVADARMYQWVDPATGSVQMSGTPPTWYRSAWGGPRVQVFDRGNVVDDTSIALTDDQNQAMRDEAFRQFDESNQLKALKRLEQDALKESARKDRLDEMAAAEGEDMQDAAPQPEDITEKTIGQLKELIESFDQLNTP